MTLKIALKPNERMIIGGAVITNGGAACNLIIENKVPILRQKDILAEDDADTPCRRIYFTVQLMYIDEKNITDYHGAYWKLVRELVEAVPSSIAYIDRISEEIVNGRYYRALKLAKKLIEFEKELVDHAKKSARSL